MENKALHFLAIGLGILLLFHGFDKLLHGTESIERMLAGLYNPSDHYGMCGFCMGEFIERMPMVKGTLLKEYAPYLPYIAYTVYIGEVIAPLFLIFNRYVRFFSAMIVLNMLVVIYLAYGDQVLSLSHDGAWAIEVPMLYLLIALTLIFGKPLKRD